MFHVTNVTKIIEIDEPLMNHMQKRMLERSTLLFKLALVWFLSRVASHMLLQVTISMESFVTPGAFLRQISKSDSLPPVWEARACSTSNIQFEHLSYIY